MKDNFKPNLIDRLADEARRGRLSRRDFMHHSIAAGLTVTAATGLWTSSAAAQPKSGGTFRAALHDANTGDTHDPGTYLSIQQIVLAHTHRSFLTMINTDQTLGGDLASEWSGSADATQWTFKLRENVTFHSGKAMTSEDVIDSMNFHRGDATTSAAKALLADVTDIVAVDSHTVRFELAGANADLPWIMTDYHLCICPSNGDGTINWESGDGTGPYRITDGQFGVGFTLERHDNWHGEGAYFDAIEYIGINDPNARQSALVGGDIDATSQVDLKTLALLNRDPNIEIMNVPSAAAITLPMNTQSAPFDNVDVRMAVKLSMNREEIVEKIAFGAGTIGNDFHHSPAMPYYPEGLDQLSYDPDQAKFLLNRAGFSNGLDISLSSSEAIFSGAVDLAVLYSEQAKASGINMEVVREPNDGYYSDVWLVKDFVAVAWGARPTPDVMYSLAYKDDAAWNESRWVNARFNELLRMGKSELDDAKRSEIYREMAVIARDDGGTVIPYFRNFVYGRRSNVMTTGEYAASWEMDGSRACHRWWFA